jgi:hypothetical protein
MRRGRRSDVLGEVAVGVGAAVAVELPHAADLLDEVEVEVGGDQLRLLLGARGEKVPRGSTK